MKKRTIRIIVLSVSFFIALFVTSHFVNQGSYGVSAEMSAATLPTISFTVEEREINPLVGHRKEMDISAVRETVLPLDNKGSLSINIQKYDEKISGLTYMLGSVDGETAYAEETIDKVGEKVEIPAKEYMEKEQEVLLTIRLDLESGKSAYYYTRVTNKKNIYFSECMEYVQTLHTQMIDGSDTNVLEKALEPSSEGNNTTLQHVTIHSDLQHATWGDLKPSIIGDVRWSIQETKSAYTSVCLKYKVECQGENGQKDIHTVKEFFQVRHVKEKNYLLSYDRTLSERFDGTKEVLTSKGIRLGFTSQEMQYKANEAGTMVAFVQASELWFYNKEESEFALVFGFANAEKEDVRHEYDAHSLKILSIEESGNLTFAVYGYMNRGDHEGESGAAIYYYSLQDNAIEEKAFIPSTESHVAIGQKLGKLAYYNDEKSELYIMNQGTLSVVDLQTNKSTVILEGTASNQYISSDNGQLIAYQKTDTEAIVYNFQTGKEQKIHVSEGEIIQPLGFVLEDVIYGVARKTDAGILPSGESIVGMYKMEIRDSKNQVVKTYQQDGKYLLDANVSGNMVTLDLAMLQNGLYTEIAEEYITNNEEKNNQVVLQSYKTERKETQFRLLFEKGIQEKTAKVLKPRQLLLERDTLMELENEAEEKYVVYGLGEIAGVFGSAGEAILLAKEISGVVISPKQHYVWEDGNRESWYRNFQVKNFVANAGETTLGACLRAVLKYERASVDVMSELGSKTAFVVLDEHCGGEAVQIKDVSVSDMRYLIDKGIPIIALTGSDRAVLLVGYDAQTVTYLDPSDGVAKTRNFSTVDEMMNGSGNTFLAYVK